MQVGDLVTLLFGVFVPASGVYLFPGSVIYGFLAKASQDSKGYIINMGVSEIRRYLILGPYTKDPTILGSILEFPIFGNSHMVPKIPKPKHSLLSPKALHLIPKASNPMRP